MALVVLKDKVSVLGPGLEGLVLGPDLEPRVLVNITALRYFAPVGLRSIVISGGATPGPGRSFALALPLKNRTWRWDLPVNDIVMKCKA